MLVANIFEAKTNLSKLIEQVLAGKEVIIARAGKPVAKLISYKEKKKPRVPGLLKGKIWISDDFNDEDKDINKLFYGGKI
ncbi:type II toxin-antitoxin system Phd/YefM family antitoxin [Candidatus Gottesmanbacteria bacterium]|nr:type II toxin-antitoxin system Phd/YefM family antitoxin [Candidatus Gottesmanbacteria bacterium]